MYAPLSSSLHSYLSRGTRRIIRAGTARLSAFTRTKVPGMRTPATGTTEASSSFSALGRASAAGYDPIAAALVSNYSVRISSTGATAIHGENGERLELADFGDAWERANREALR